MRNQAVVLAAAAVVVAVVAGTATVVVTLHRTRATTPGPEPVPSPAAYSARPVPTVTVTKRKIVRETVRAPAPRYYGGDAEFLALIARDGIKAPDDWAITAGRETCGTSYSYAYRYLTDGGLYSYHVQTFIDDWISTHGSC